MSERKKLGKEVLEELHGLAGKLDTELTVEHKRCYGDVDDAFIFGDDKSTKTGLEYFLDLNKVTIHLRAWCEISLPDPAHDLSSIKNLVYFDPPELLFDDCLASTGNTIRECVESGAEHVRGSGCYEDFIRLYRQLMADESTDYTDLPDWF